MCVDILFMSQVLFTEMNNMLAQGMATVSTILLCRSVVYPLCFYKGLFTLICQTITAL